MTEEEKDIELERTIFHLKQKIEFNERLRCPRVAARYRRELEKLVNESKIKARDNEKNESLLRLGKVRCCPEETRLVCHVRERHTGMSERAGTKMPENNSGHRD